MHNNGNTERLNALYGDFLNCTHSPVIVRGAPASVTLALNVQDAFTLNPPHINLLHIDRPQAETSADQVIIRCFIPHSEHLFDFNYGIFELAQYKNEMLLTMAQFLSLPNRRHSFARPGREREFFMEVDTPPLNYELRLFGTKG